MGKLSSQLGPTEHEIQSAYFDWVAQKAINDSRYLSIYAVPNGAHFAKGAKTYVRMASEGLKKGVPDINIDHPTRYFHGARIEAKRKGGVLSTEQKEWLTRLSRNGFACAVTYSLEEMISFTEKYFG